MTDMNRAQARQLMGFTNGVSRDAESIHSSLLELLQDRDDPLVVAASEVVDAAHALEDKAAANLKACSRPKQPGQFKVDPESGIVGSIGEEAPQ